MMAQGIIFQHNLPQSHEFGFIPGPLDLPVGGEKFFAPPDGRKDLSLRRIRAFLFRTEELLENGFCGMSALSAERLAPQILIGLLLNFFERRFEGP